MQEVPVDQAFGYAMKFHQAGRAREADTLYRRVIAAMPTHADAHQMLGLLAYECGNAEEAIQMLRRAIEIRPGTAAYHSNLGNMLAQLGRPHDAIVECRKAIQFDPRLAASYNNLGIALVQIREYDEAIDSYTTALRIQPDYVDALNNLGNAQRAVGLLDDAIASFRRAIALTPDQDSPSYHDYLFSLHYHPDYDAPAILAELKTWSDKFEPVVQPPTYRNTPDPNRRLRVAYLCANFGDHVHALFHAPLLGAHDRTQVEVFGYSNVEVPDAVTSRLRGLCDQWREIFNMSDEQVAQQIQADQIDILVDEVMHMAQHRLMTYAHWPAPIQMTWLAYPGTTGTRSIQYRLTDPFLDPPDTEAGKYSEASIRLPDTYLCYGPPTDDPVRESPAVANGYITFGCTNNFVKVNDRVISLWSRLLAQVPRARLLMVVPPGRARQRVLATFARGGITEDRIEFVPFQSRSDYMATYHRVDIALDTFPYNGYTTSLDSFWMGVPVVTIVGRTITGRATWSALNNLKLTELAAQDEESFIAMASALAGDLPRLQSLRATMRDRMKNSPLTDAPRFARGIESIYRTLWQRWCATRASIDVSPGNS